ncbi:MAG TPA: hypothetical protein VK961_25990 [Chthoniobacter sp.]|nr:hypothetical protein [Chthoniobacter sp.]
MRFVGLTLALLASSLGARAESVEDRVNALEARVKALEAALQTQDGKAVAHDPSGVEGTYRRALPNGDSISLTFSQGKITASNGKIGTYEVSGKQVTLLGDGKPKVMSLDGDHLRAVDGTDKVDFVRIK